MTKADNFELRSRAPGAMHACGHDGHAAMLPGAARHLDETRNFDGPSTCASSPLKKTAAGAGEVIRDGMFKRFPRGEVNGIA